MLMPSYLNPREAERLPFFVGGAAEVKAYYATDVEVIKKAMQQRNPKTLVWALAAALRKVANQHKTIQYLTDSARTREEAGVQLDVLLREAIDLRQADLENEPTGQLWDRWQRRVQSALLVTGFGRQDGISE